MHSKLIFHQRGKKEEERKQQKDISTNKFSSYIELYYTHTHLRNKQIFPTNEYTHDSFTISLIRSRPNWNEKDHEHERERRREKSR